MNTINNNFSLRRLWNVLRIDLRAYTNTRMMYIGILFIFLASESGDLRHCIASYKMGVVDASQLFAMYVDGLAPMFYAFLVGMMLFSISTLSAMGEKNDAIYYLSLPASNKEKFVSRVLIALVEPIVFVILAMLVVDLLRIGLVEYRMGVNPDYAVLSADFKGFTVPALLGKGWQTIQDMFMHGGTEYVNAAGEISMAGFGFSTFRGVLMVLLCIVSLLFVHSLFLLIGSCWTNFTAMALTIVGGTLFILRGRAIDAVASAGDGAVTAYNGLLQHEAWSVVVLLLLSALTILCWRVGYRNFARKQIVMPDGFLSKTIKNRKEAAV